MLLFTPFSLSLSLSIFTLNIAPYALKPNFQKLSEANNLCTILIYKSTFLQQVYRRIPILYLRFYQNRDLRIHYIDSPNDDLSFK